MPFDYTDLVERLEGDGIAPTFGDYLATRQRLHGGVEVNISLDDLWKDESRRFRLLVKFYGLKYKFEWKIYSVKRRIQARFPILINEGEATARLIDRTFNYYPFIEDYTLEQATEQLQSIWNIIDNWDGSRTNVSEILESK